MNKPESIPARTKPVLRTLRPGPFSDTTGKMILAGLGLLFFVALFAGLISNDRPWFARINEKAVFPVFQPSAVDSFFNEAEGRFIRFQFDQADWKKIPLKAVIWAPVPYGPASLDKLNSGFIGPFDPQFAAGPSSEKINLPLRFRHWLGTDKNGHDLLARLIHGSRNSLMVGVLALAIASLIGLSLGALAGFFGDERMKWKRGILLAFIPGLFFVWFFGFHVRRFELADAAGLSPYRFAWECLLSLLVSGAVLLVFWLMGKAISRIPFLSRSISIPVDSVISRLIEVLNSMPTILLIISFSVVFRKSIALLILIIGIFGWTQIARLTRAEMLRISNLDYMDAARAMGFGTFRLIFRHALPNGLGPVTVAIAFGIAGAIIIESALSFLGIGVPDDAVTWGKLLSIARSRYSAWWMAVFPGFAIFFTVSLFNLLGEKLRNHFEQLEPVQAQEPDKK